MGWSRWVDEMRLGGVRRTDGGDGLKFLYN